jgi:hypothetical protein
MKSQTQNAHLSEINQDFAPLVPSVNKAFEKIWTYKDMTEFRGNWTTTRGTYPAFVPTEGFDITHQMVPIPGGLELEIRIWKPQDAKAGEKLPLLYVLHGGGKDSTSLARQLLIMARICCGRT